MTCKVLSKTALLAALTATLPVELVQNHDRTGAIRALLALFPVAFSGHDSYLWGIAALFGGSARI